MKPQHFVSLISVPPKMPRFLCWLLAFGFLFSSAVALPGMLVAANIRSAFSSSTSLRRASLDPFYTAPTGYEKKSPGTILRFRPAPGNATSLISNCSAIYNILFRTTNSHYQPSWAVTTVFVPLDISQNETNHKNRPPLLSYQVPYNTDDNDFSPSLLLYETALPSDISAALGRGWYVNVPDFEGTLASFTAGVQEGHATLDSVRAALSAGLGVDFKSRYALWGYSGGSIASEVSTSVEKFQIKKLISFLISGLRSFKFNTHRNSISQGWRSVAWYQLWRI